MHASQSAMDPADRLYLRLAWEAIVYVRSKVIRGSQNREDDKIEREQKNVPQVTLLELNRERTSILSSIQERQKQISLHHQMQAPEIIDMDDQICHGAAMTEANQLGNCGEQAGVAYCFLRQWPIGGLCYVDLINGNHTFLVLGAGPNFIEGQNFTIAQAKVALGDSAIICDPWLYGKGLACRVGDRWEDVVAEMVEQANPGTDLNKIRVSCGCRYRHKTRRTKELQWFADQRDQKISEETQKKQDNAWSWWW